MGAYCLGAHREKSPVAKGSFRQADRSEAKGRMERARNLLRQAQSLDALAAGDGDAVGIMDLCVNAVIAFTDALTIVYAGIQNDQDHQAAPRALAAALGNRADAEQIARLKRLLTRKGAIQYDHRPMRLDEARNYLQQAERYGEWAEASFRAI